MSVRDVLPVTDAGDGYATVSAGSRARGALADQQVLEPDEDFFGTPAAAVFRRNTGVTATSGLVAFGFPALVRRNDRLDYDAEIGALGEALAAAGVPRAVIANADGAGPARDRGAVPNGGQRAHRPTRHGPRREPCPRRSSSPRPPPRTASVSSPERGDGGLRGGLGPRWGGPRGGVRPRARRSLHAGRGAGPSAGGASRGAPRRPTRIVARLLESVDPARDSVLVVAPYHAEAAVHLTVAGMRGPGIEPGLLRSGSTRRAGLVTLVDIAPTILDLAGVERPDSMEGRRFEPVTGGPATGDRAGRAPRRASTRRPATAIGWWRPSPSPSSSSRPCCGSAPIVAIRRGAPAGRRTVALAALALLAFLPATYLAGLIDFHASPATAYWVFVVGLAVALAVAGARRWAAGRCSTRCCWCSASCSGLLVVDMLARRATCS